VSGEGWAEASSDTLFISTITNGISKNLGCVASTSTCYSSTPVAVGGSSKVYKSE
jgi:hypothetical protein